MIIITPLLNSGYQISLIKYQPKLSSVYDSKDQFVGWILNILCYATLKDRVWLTREINTEISMLQTALLVVVLNQISKQLYFHPICYHPA